MTPLLSSCMGFDGLNTRAPFGRILEAQPFQGSTILPGTPTFPGGFIYAEFSYYLFCFLKYQSKNWCPDYIRYHFKNGCHQMLLNTTQLTLPFIEYYLQLFDVNGRDALNTNGAQVQVLFTWKFDVIQGCGFDCQLTNSVDTSTAFWTICCRRPAILVIRLPLSLISIFLDMYLWIPTFCFIL